MTARGGISGIGRRIPKPARDWRAASAKLDADEQRCRNWMDSRCHTQIGQCERAHIIGREHDFTEPVRPILEPYVWKPGVVWLDRIIPLCRSCHDLQHRKRLDLLPLLNKWEQVQAVADAGSIATAIELLMPSESRKIR